MNTRCQRCKQFKELYDLKRNLCISCFHAYVKEECHDCVKLNLSCTGETLEECTGLLEGPKEEGE